MQPDLAASYTTIAEQGPDALYGVRTSPSLPTLPPDIYLDSCMLLH